MAKRLVCVFDKKAEHYRSVFMEATRETAIRSFTDAIVRGRDNMLRIHADDYRLVEVGTFDEEQGIIDAWMAPHILIEASEVMRRAEKQLQEEAELDEVSNG